ncbi:hypothetical protein CENSYa_1830 [Cenarchaeum symbiosum A]|uniref:Uncharacterized protein n=1 Tax=Cenarchaeum symbiosum (strain A) TaxID=414004 RepID=A0RYM3_CENSY|nr:hypothetical protein CENSYa_1830 [Cenarchaeum symbiosum A]
MFFNTNDNASWKERCWDFMEHLIWSFHRIDKLLYLALPAIRIALSYEPIPRAFGFLAFLPGAQNVFKRPGHVYTSVIFAMAPTPGLGDPAGAHAVKASTAYQRLCRI